jgi:hypothetical protein
VPANTDREKFNFAPGTCRRHRAQYTKVCVEEGIHDYAVIDKIRFLFYSEIGRKFSRPEVHQFLSDVCIGCNHGDWAESTVRALARAEVQYPALHHPPDVVYAPKPS